MNESMDAMAAVAERKGLKFRERPFVMTYVFTMARDGYAKELALMEIMKEHLAYHDFFEVKEIGQ